MYMFKDYSIKNKGLIDSSCVNLTPPPDICYLLHHSARIRCFLSTKLTWITISPPIELLDNSYCQVYSLPSLVKTTCRTHVSSPNP